MDWRNNTIIFDYISPEKYYWEDCKEKKIKYENTKFEDAEYAILWHMKHKNESFDYLYSSENLQLLELHSANLKDFTGVDKFRNLKRLELHYCTKLKSDIGIENISQTLQNLHINQSKKFVISDRILNLKELRVLRLNSCGPIDNLDFLKEFPNLVDFRFVDTTIIDGNLTPILEHPTLQSVGFLNKRHYNIKEKEMDFLLKEKTKDYPHKTSLTGTYIDTYFL